MGFPQTSRVRRSEGGRGVSAKLSWRKAPSVHYLLLLLSIILL
uniref:Uncharacterized protein n=1 Tax=Anguilla anguilla TaxID=7936 RepID=A0A0E9WNB5_ANGAN